MEKINLVRTCPVCNSLLGEVLHNQSFIQPEDSPLPANYNIVCCLNCGFVFADTPSDQDTYNDYYKRLSKYEDLETATGGGINQLDLKRLELTASVIHRLLPKMSDSILDIGCANGGLLNVLRKNGYYNILGVDPSLSCVQHVQSLGIKCVVGDIFSSAFNEIQEKFDCIILTHVFEHIYDLKNAVENISAKLNDNGIIYIEVPDASSYADYYSVPYYYIDCEHINHFEENSLINLFISKEYTLVEAKSIELNVSSTQKYPAIYSVFRMKKGNASNQLHSPLAKESFNKFLEQSKKQDENDNLIKQLVEKQEPIIIWGAGQFTLRLLANSTLGKCNIKGFIDSDSNKQGKKLYGLSIHTPDFLANTDCAVVICSALHHEEIRNTVNSLKISHPIYIMK
ncbi:MAG: methyltransferase domain-containing protein [bacterium]